MNKGCCVVAAAFLSVASGQMFPGMSQSSANPEPAMRLSMPRPAGLGAGQFRGAVPQGTVTGSAMDLSLAEAVRLGLDRNLGALLTSNNERVAQTERMIALARMLPQIHAGVDERSQQMNLAAFGFPPSDAFPSVVGPYKVFDARAYVSQSLFSLRNLYEKRAKSRELDAAVLDFLLV